MRQMQMASDDFETGVYRPPSEGGSNSLLVRVTRNCPWNRCTFCAMYKTEKFEVRSPARVKQDIDAMASIARELTSKTEEGVVTRDAVVDLLENQPHLNHHPGFAMLVQWLLSGARTAFLQDANSLVMKTEHLVDVLAYLRKTFPSLARVTSYARSER